MSQLSGLMQRRTLDPIYQYSEVKGFMPVGRILGAYICIAKCSACYWDADPVLEHVLQLPAFVYSVLVQCFA